MIVLRRIKLSDLGKYEYWKLPHHKYHLLNGPYFTKKSKEEVEKYIQELRLQFQQGDNVLDNVRIIFNEQHQMIGEVSWYWKSKETNWLEIGIVIFDETFWGKGIGYLALNRWIDEVFKEKPELVRIGLTTWSGNFGMIKLAQKLGLTEEARYKKARIVNGEYFDSVSFGILKEDWNKLQQTI